MFPIDHLANIDLMKHSFLLGCMIIVGACSSVGNSGEEEVGLVPAAIQTEEAKAVFVPEPTLEGSWAGLPYDENWELRIVEADEKREDPSLYAYFEGQELLENRNYDGCELTYWFGALTYDEFGEYPEVFSHRLGYKETINDRDFDISLTLIYGKLDVIGYSFISELGHFSNVPQNGYIGSFLLRLIDTAIDPCIRETEWLLAEVNPSGMYAMRDPFMEWNNERRFGVP